MTDPQILTQTQSQEEPSSAAVLSAVLRFATLNTNQDLVANAQVHAHRLDGGGPPWEFRGRLSGSRSVPEHVVPRGRGKPQKMTHNRNVHTYVQRVTKL